jgi:hypothetical protein
MIEPGQPGFSMIKQFSTKYNPDKVSLATGERQNFGILLAV